MISVLVSGDDGCSDVNMFGMYYAVVVGDLLAGIQG
jgi:hypothetical protein